MKPTARRTRKPADVVDKKARAAVEFLAAQCYHVIGDIGYRQVQEMLVTEIRKAGAKRGRVGE